jgi:hypothetical protein
MRQGHRTEKRLEELERQARDGADVEAGDETVFMADYGNPAAAPPATLVVVESLVLDAGTVFEIKGTTSVGRTDRNTVNIPDKPVSRRHAEVFFEQGAYRIRDLGSRNGVRVDGKRVSADGGRLADGAYIQLGPQTILEFNYLPQAPVDDKTRRYGS